MLKRILKKSLIITILCIGAIIQFSVTTHFVFAKSNELNQFEVGKYLKIENGQTYLDSKSGDDHENSASLKNGITYFIIQFIELASKVIGSFALLFLITGGFTLMISHGNSQLQTKGKQMILYPLIGLAVVFLSLIIVTFVQSLFFTL